MDNALKGAIVKKLTVVALALAAAGAAYADDPSLDTYGAIAATKTRAEVRAELVQARRDGSIKVWSTSYEMLALAKPAKTRTRVLRELDAAQATGELRAFNGEDGGSAYMAAPTTRPAVTAVRVLAGPSSGPRWGS